MRWQRILYTHTHIYIYIYILACTAKNQQLTKHDQWSTINGPRSTMIAMIRLLVFGAWTFGGRNPPCALAISHCTIPVGVHMSTKNRKLSSHDGTQSSITVHLLLTVTHPDVSRGGQDDPRLSRAILLLAITRPGHPRQGPLTEKPHNQPLPQ